MGDEVCGTSRVKQKLDTAIHISICAFQYLQFAIIAAIWIKSYPIVFVYSTNLVHFSFG